MREKKMNNKIALLVLIENSVILSQITKDKLRMLVEKMTNEEIEEWGKLLAVEQTFIAENKEKILVQINSFLDIN